MKELDGNIAEFLMNEEKMTFLVGAGCSIDAPSCLPAGKKMMDEIIKFFCPETEFQKISGISELRFEALVEIVRDHGDIDLKIIDYYGECDKPNKQHFFLAEMIKKGHFLMTTNFDFLIEHALLQSNVAKSEVLPVITRNDFERYADPEKLFNEGKMCVYKVHGSTKNLITEESTRESLVATIQAFGSNKEGFSVFQIEPFKKKLFNNISKDRTLVILGYSGSDDFDIVPTLKALTGFRNVIWINYSDKFGTKGRIIEMELTDNPDDISKVSQVLLYVKRRNKESGVYLIDANTSDIVATLLSFEPNLSDENFFLAPSHWFEEKIGVPEEILKYFIAQTTYFELSMLSDSMRCGKEILRLSEGLEDISLKIRALNLVGKDHHELGNYTEALNLYKEALKIAEESEMAIWISACYSNIANVYNVQGKFEVAAEYHLKSIPVFESLGDKLAVGKTQASLGAIYKNLGKNSEGLEALQKSKMIFEDLGKLADKADTLTVIGMIYSSLGDINSALQNYTEANHINDQLHNQNGKIVSLNAMGQLYQLQGNFSAAQEVFSEALSISREIGDLLKEASMLNNIGLLFLNQYNLDSAISYFEKALPLAEKINDPMTVGTCYGNMGTVYFYQQDHSQALKMFTKSLKIFEDSGYLLGEANMLINTGKIHYEKGKLKKALPIFNRALEIGEKTGEVAVIAESLQNIGMIHEDLKNYQEALNNYNRALEIAKSLGNPAMIASNIHNIGTVDFYMGNYTEALKQYDNALQILNQYGLGGSPLAQTIIRNIQHCQKTMHQ